jgi:hypothetical protein
LILKGLNGAIASKRVTYDFARLMEGATEIKCSQFGDNVIEHMWVRAGLAVNDEARNDDECPGRRKPGSVLIWRITLLPIGQEISFGGCYAWSFLENGKPEYTTVLEIPPVDSAESAVKVAIASKAR